MVTINKDDYQWVNKETASAGEAILNTQALNKLASEMLYGANNIGTIADNLEGLMWLLWEGTTPDGEDMKPIDWTQITNRLIDLSPKIDWDEFQDSLDSKEDE